MGRTRAGQEWILRRDDADDAGLAPSISFIFSRLVAARFWNTPAYQLQIASVSPEQD